MTERRAYREPLSAEEALAELRRCAGTQFDPHVVELFAEHVYPRVSALMVADEDGVDAPAGVAPSSANGDAPSSASAR
jgi:HD-GYP domain-containing protein (c-di-GMP phosphodiesterase class II)